jgi:meiotically up-regulated gene 157 (Mug157) protein
VDGFGNVFFGDDANTPSLLSLPYLGYVSADDPTYLSTRQYVLNAATNPFFYGPGTEGVSGVGSEDVGGNVGWVSVLFRYIYPTRSPTHHSQLAFASARVLAMTRDISGR